MPSEPYLGEIRMYAGTTPPPGWAFCDGSAIAINVNTALYTLIGTTYGGNPNSYFNLPDLRGRFFVSTDNNTYFLGATGGAEQVSLQDVNLPAHTHPVFGSPSGGSDTPKGLTWGPSTQPIYAPPAVGAKAKAMNTLGIKNAGNGKPHENMIPFLVINYIIALVGIYPSGDAEDGREGGNADGNGAAAIATDENVAFDVNTPADADDQILSELRIFPYPNVVPRGWMVCNGQQLSQNANRALFTLLGTTFGGGNGFFNLPNMVARVPMHAAFDFPYGQQGGEAAHQLTLVEMPAHNHLAQASSNGASTANPAETCWATNTGLKLYGGPATVRMSSQALLNGGADVPHENQSPYLVLNVCMAISGIYPTRS